MPKEIPDRLQRELQDLLRLEKVQARLEEAIQTGETLHVLVPVPGEPGKFELQSFTPALDIQSPGTVGRLLLAFNALDAAFCTVEAHQ